MIRTKRRTTVCLILLCLNIVFIWGNSLLVGELSGALSKMVASVINWLIGDGGPLSGAGGHGLLRKLAHFSEFLMLGILLRWYAGMHSCVRWRRAVLPLAVGLLVAAADETIQVFVPGRGPSVRDVGIDFCGVVVGALMLYLCWRIRKSLKKAPAAV